MKVRDVYLTQAQTLTDSGSLTFPLSQLGKILHIRVKLSATNGATSNTVGKLVGWVSKIEVVDGSNVLASCSMIEWLAANCFNNQVMPFRDDSAGAAVVITDEIVVTFGRFFGDREYYLDCSRFANPMLRITWSFTVSGTAGVATGTEQLSLLCTTIEDQALPYKGFIMRKEVGSWTTAASGNQSFILPLDYPYMGIYVSALKTTVAPDTILTNFKLSRNTDQYIDYNITGRDAYAKNVETFGYFSQKFRPLVDTTATWLGDLYFQTGAWMSRPGATSKALTTAVLGESVTTFGTTGGSVDTQELELQGCAPGAACYLPFHYGDPYNVPNPDDFLNPTGLGELKLILTQGVASAAGTVVVEQVHP
jgi:hypothetical protein